jgi:ligand-binding sensor domain-containing protein
MITVYKILVLVFLYFLSYRISNVQKSTMAFRHLTTDDGFLWITSNNGGVNKFDPATETFTYYRNDSEGQFVGYDYDLVEDNRGDIWFVGDHGLFHVNTQTGLITCSLSAINRLAAHNICEDKAGNLRILVYSPVALIKYNHQTSRHSVLSTGMAGLFGQKVRL